jgi:hypothetical protein
MIQGFFSPVWSVGRCRFESLELGQSFLKIWLGFRMIYTKSFKRLKKMVDYAKKRNEHSASAIIITDKSIFRTD